jgi:hypothetical protein
MLTINIKVQSNGPSAGQEVLKGIFHGNTWGMNGGLVYLISTSTYNHA